MGDGLLGDFADRRLNPRNGARAAGGYAVPPRLEGGEVAVQFHAHAAGELDPVGETMARDRDHHRNVPVDRAFDQVGEALAITLSG